MLTDHLKRLADFDDIEAEERAMAYAMSCPSLFAALRFFLDWPSPALAAQLLVSRHEDARTGVIRSPQVQQQIS